MESEGSLKLTLGLTNRNYIMKYLALLEYDNLLHCDTGRDADMKKEKLHKKYWFMLNYYHGNDKIL